MRTKKTKSLTGWVQLTTEMTGAMTTIRPTKRSLKNTRTSQRSHHQARVVGPAHLMTKKERWSKRITRTIDKEVWLDFKTLIRPLHQVSRVTSRSTDFCRLARMMNGKTMTQMRDKHSQSNAGLLRRSNYSNKMNHKKVS